MIQVNSVCPFPTNKKASVYLVDKDAYHNEDFVMVATDVDVHYREEVASSRTYRPDKSIADTEAVEKIVYIPATKENEEILGILKRHDALEIDGDLYRIFDVYKGYDPFGNLQFVKLKLL